MDIPAYDRAVDDHSDAVFRFAAKHLRCREAAKDLVQDCYLRLWMNLDRVDGNKVKSYLFTMAHHLIVDHVRRDRKRARLEPHHEDRLTTRQPHAGLQHLLGEALKTLTPQQRTLVLLRDLEGFPYDEIGRMMDLDITRVKVYLFRARKAMKDFIGDLDLVL